MDEIISYTRGKRVLIAGGQGSRNNHKVAIKETLELESLEWCHGERGQTRFPSIRPGKYDLVLFLARFAGHQSEGFVRSVRKAGIRLIYLTTGYGLTQIIEAIRKQAVQFEKQAA